MVSNASISLTNKKLTRIRDSFIASTVKVLNKVLSTKYVKLRIDKHVKGVQCRLRFLGDTTYVRVSKGAVESLSNEELALLCVLSSVPKVRAKHVLAYSIVAMVGLASVLISALMGSSNNLVKTLGTVLGMIVFTSSILAQVISESLTKREFREFLKYDKVLKDIDGTYAEARELVLTVFGKVINYLSSGRTSLLINEVITDKVISKLTYLKSFIK